MISSPARTTTLTQRLAAALRPDSCRGAPYQPPFLIPKRLFDICLKEAHEFPFQVTQPVHDSRFNMLPKLRVLNLSCQTRELWIQLFEVLLLFVSQLTWWVGREYFIRGTARIATEGLCINYACLCVAVSMCIAFTIVKPAAAQDEVPQEAPPAEVGPAPKEAPPPVANPAVGTLRRQNRRQFLYEEQQRNDAEDALEKRGETAAENRSNAAQNRGGGAAAERNRGGGAGRRR